MSKKNQGSKLTIERETLRRLSDATLHKVVGAGDGHASAACENGSFGFLCGQLCGASKSCAPK